ncbi:Uncharacterised protein [Mycobacteroides abscessus subsp. abscessus]|uniref:hypothetical protein n=1 Tax=Mycobacteroides abscessus TaxID=36809 RepID=UPI000929B0A6|nr:hypothetical protein [Mycobacteroides abscessus]SHX65852.1 Uncharacterised protein [Mycobacteroides abscessus subsp. abscessus]SIC60876.1 Uncharacterised protein [Mycobacteroides abscessus subsp. abscessus]SKK21498.1 Uncharacterised protein [Mycobacteroides abscessus subsp. abscessus]SKP50758.1 Uncharacterised protein [Mycobacteroides abscessus subsp. abscessus]
MGTNEIQNTDPVPDRRRRNVIAAAVLAVLGITVGGYVLHNAGVIAGQQQGREQVRTMLIDAASTASASTPVLDTGRSAGAGTCLTTVTIDGSVWVLPDGRGGQMRRPTGAEAKALSERGACGGVVIPN